MKIRFFNPITYTINKLSGIWSSEIEKPKILSVLQCPYSDTPLYEVIDSAFQENTPNTMQILCQNTMEYELDKQLFYPSTDILDFIDFSLNPPSLPYLEHQTDSTGFKIIQCNLYIYEMEISKYYLEVHVDKRLKLLSRIKKLEKDMATSFASYLNQIRTLQLLKPKLIALD